MDLSGEQVIGLCIQLQKSGGVVLVTPCVCGGLLHRNFGLLWTFSVVGVLYEYTQCIDNGIAKVFKRFTTTNRAPTIPDMYGVEGGRSSLPCTYACLRHKGLHRELTGKLPMPQPNWLVAYRLATAH